MCVIGAPCSSSSGGPSPPLATRMLVPTVSTRPRAPSIAPPLVCTSDTVKPVRKRLGPGGSGACAANADRPAYEVAATAAPTCTNSSRRFISDMALPLYLTAHGCGSHFDPSASFLKWLVVTQGVFRYCGSVTIVVTTNQLAPPGSSNRS